MAKTSCDLRVFVRFDDGTMGVMAIDSIPTASRLRDELGVVADVMGDPECGEDWPHEDDLDPLYRDVFAQAQSPLTRGWRETP